MAWLAALAGGAEGATAGTAAAGEGAATTGAATGGAAEGVGGAEAAGAAGAGTKTGGMSSLQGAQKTDALQSLMGKITGKIKGGSGTEATAKAGAYLQQHAMASNPFNNSLAMPGVTMSPLATSIYNNVSKRSTQQNPMAATNMKLPQSAPPPSATLSTQPPISSPLDDIAPKKDVQALPQSTLSQPPTTQALPDDNAPPQKAPWYNTFFNNLTGGMR